jgi:ATP-dependent RNA helicase UAP56/SUB2
MRQTVQKIFVETNHKKQVLMFTATLNEKITATAKKFMRENPKEIKINEEKNLTLHGLQQFYIDAPEEMKNKIFFSILHKISFNQVIVFCSKVSRAKFLNQMICKYDFESIAIHSDLNQLKR